MKLSKKEQKKLSLMSEIGYNDFAKIVSFKDLFLANCIVLWSTQLNILGDIYAWVRDTIKYLSLIVFFPISKYVFYRYAVKQAKKTLVEFEEIGEENKVKNKYCKKTKDTVA